LRVGISRGGQGTEEAHRHREVAPLKGSYSVLELPRRRDAKQEEHEKTASKSGGAKSRPTSIL
jgi:hypothetical protein